MSIEPLRQFQGEDVPFFLTHKRALMLYEPRLGKTVVSCNVMALDDLCINILVLCSKNAMFVWYDHIKEWFNHICPGKTLDIRLLRGKGGTAPEIRKALWIKPRTADITVYISTFAAMNRDFKFLTLPSTMKLVSFDTVVGDEIHLQLRNRKNIAVKQMKVLTHPRVCRRVLLLSGTLASKGGPSDFWACLNILNPGEFSSYWRFVDTFYVTEKNHWGGLELLGIKNLGNFHKILDRYGRRRFRNDVAPQMPKVQRELLKVEATEEQQTIIDGLQESGFAWSQPQYTKIMLDQVEGETEQEAKLIIAPNSMEAVLRVRQLMTCPKILDPRLGVGAAMEDLLERLKDPEISPNKEDQHIVIFTAFRSALNHFEQALRDNGFNDVWQLYGGLEPEDLRDRIAKFKATQGIILCTIKYAQAFSLAPSQQCFTIGYEWDPNDNKQAEDRLVPQVGIQPINSYYYSYLGIDEGIAESVNIKNRTISLTIGSAQHASQ